MRDRTHKVKTCYVNIKWALYYVTILLWIRTSNLYQVALTLMETPSQNLVLTCGTKLTISYREYWRSDERNIAV